MDLQHTAPISMYFSISRDLKQNLHVLPSVPVSVSCGPTVIELGCASIPYLPITTPQAMYRAIYLPLYVSLLCSARAVFDPRSGTLIGWTFFRSVMSALWRYSSLSFAEITQAVSRALMELYAMENIPLTSYIDCSLNPAITMTDLMRNFVVSYCVAAHSQMTNREPLVESEPASTLSSSPISSQDE